MTATSQGTPLLRLSRRRFRNFSDAASEVLDALAAPLPGVIALGKLDPDERAHKLIEVRGETPALERGISLPLAGDGIDPAFFEGLGARSWIAMPLEMSGGSITGILCAVSAEEDAYSPDQEGTLGVAARLLALEWESVELRSELRRLRAGANAGPRTDADTGLPNRKGFIDLVQHEWRLVQRGTVESVLVACRVRGGAEADGAGDSEARRRLAIKVAAEVLEGSTRVTDRVGRIGDATLGAILVGCSLADAPAFVARFLSALERVTEGQLGVEASCGVRSLAESPSPEEAVALAESASEPGRGRRDSAAEGDAGMNEGVSTHSNGSANFHPGAMGVTPPSSRSHRGAFLTDVIVELGFADRETVERAELSVREAGQRIEEFMLTNGLLDENQLSLAIAERHGLDHVDLDSFEVDLNAARIISRSAAERYGAVPFAFGEDGSLVVAVEDPLDSLGISDIEVMSRSEVRRVIASPSGIRRLIERLADEAPRAGQETLELDGQRRATPPFSSEVAGRREEAGGTDERASVVGRRIEEPKPAEEQARQLEQELETAREQIEELQQRVADADAAVADRQSS